MEQVRVGGRSVRPSAVFETYWRFAAERQRVYHRRLSDPVGPWTEDPVLTTYRFTNAYRAADRVTQDLIRLQYAGSQDPRDIVLRTVLFRLFNKPSTWQTLERAFGSIGAESFDVAEYSAVLDASFERGDRLYSAAYIIPPPPFGAARKHRNHLLLLEHMMASGIVDAVVEANSLRRVFDVISSYPSLGPFLAYQLTIDLNYSSMLRFDENDFVVPGPGARSGLAKCFPDAPADMAADLIRWMVDNQERQLDRFDLDFQDLFGRRLTLIDCQNLFCETDKYARVVHPEVRGAGNRTRIKQQFSPLSTTPPPFFPPKWGLHVPTPSQRDLALTPA